MTDQDEALRLAEMLEEAAGDYTQWYKRLGYNSAAKLREQRVEIQKLREALSEMLEEAEDGIAICPLTKIKSRNALNKS